MRLSIRRVSVHLPEPIGNAWILATNVGEWHLLNERGFYISRLFQGDQLKMKELKVFFGFL